MELPKEAAKLHVKWTSLSKNDRRKCFYGLSPAEQEKMLAYRPELVEAVEAEKKAQKPQMASVKPKRQGYGRWEMFNKFVDLTPTELTPAQRVVWMTMFRRADGKDNTLESSVRVLANQTGLTDKTVQQAIAKLVETGWLRYIFKSPSKGTPSRFRMLTSVEISSN